MTDDLPPKLTDAIRTIRRAAVQRPDGRIVVRLDSLAPSLQRFIGFQCHHETGDQWTVCVDVANNVLRVARVSG